MKIIPAIDLIEGKTVRLKQGEYNRKLSYDIAPVDAAKKWADMGAELIHVVDLDGAREGRPRNLSVAEEIVKATGVPVEVGGGYRTKKDIETALGVGVRRVIIGSKAFEDFDFGMRSFETFGDKIIISADARNFEVKTHGWEQDLDCNFFDILKKFVCFGAKEIIYTDIQKDGMLTGPSTENIKKILEEINIKVVSAGGVKTLAHIVELRKLEKRGLKGVIVGRALYEGTIDLREAIYAGKTDNPVSGC